MGYFGLWFLLWVAKGCGVGSGIWGCGDGDVGMGLWGWVFVAHGVTIVTQGLRPPRRVPQGVWGLWVGGMHIIYQFFFNCFF